MKLKTTQNGSHDLIDATDENLIHDAMAAHALMRAMEDVDQWPTAARVFKARVDALLREWTGGG